MHFAGWSKLDSLGSVVELAATAVLPTLLSNSFAMTHVLARCGWGGRAQVGKLASVARVAMRAKVLVRVDVVSAHHHRE